MSDQRELRERLNLANEIEKYEASRYWRAGDWVRIVAALREADDIASLRGQLDNANLVARHEAAVAEGLRSQLVKARKALEKIDKSDRIWTSHYAKDETDVLERAPSGNVLVHGHEGSIARDALIALTDEEGKS